MVDQTLIPFRTVLYEYIPDLLDLVDLSTTDISMCMYSIGYQTRVSSIVMRVLVVVIDIRYETNRSVGVSSEPKLEKGRHSTRFTVLSQHNPTRRKPTKQTKETKDKAANVTMI